MFSLVNTIDNDSVVNIKAFIVESLDNLTIKIKKEEKTGEQVVSKNEMSSTSGKKER